MAKVTKETFKYLRATVISGERGSGAHAPGDGRMPPAPLQPPAGPGRSCGETKVPRLHGPPPPPAAGPKRTREGPRGRGSSAHGNADPGTLDLTWSGETNPLNCPSSTVCTRPLGGRPEEGRRGQTRILGGESAMTHPRRNAGPHTGEELTLG